MTFEEVIISLSRTPYDVSYYQNQIIIQESTPSGWVKVGSPEGFNGTYEEAIIKGTEKVLTLENKPKSKRNRRKRK